MPEFILDHGTAYANRKYKQHDAFTQGYIEAMFFTSTGMMEDEDLEDATVSDLAPDTWARIERDCAAFQLKAKDLLVLAYERADYDEEAAGRDYWYTRNGHGVGFWDRSPLDEDGLGDKLSALCRYTEVSLYRGDDGLIYLA